MSSVEWFTISLRRTTGDKDLIKTVSRAIVFALLLFGSLDIDAKGKEATDGQKSESVQVQPLPSPVISYDFNEGQGGVIHDRIGHFKDVDLVISDLEAVTWIAGGLQIESPVELVTESAASEIIQAVKRSESFAIEAWVDVDELSQSGPARLISVSKDPSHRNFTLGQDGDRFDFRLRTTKRDRNGMPSTAAPEGSLEAGRVHIVVSRGVSGEVTIYQNGHPLYQDPVSGDLSNWDDSFKLCVSNEVGGGRPWVGKLFRVSIYDQLLTDSQVLHLHREGSEGENRLSSEQIKLAKQQQFFREHVAPLFVESLP